MTKMENSPADVGALSQEDYQRALLELVADAGPRGVAPEALYAACGELDRVAVKAALWQGWKEGRLRVGWSATEKRLTWSPREVTP